MSIKEDAVSSTTDFGWFGRFRSGEMNVGDHSRSCLPPTSRNDENIGKSQKK